MHNRALNNILRIERCFQTYRRQQLRDTETTPVQQLLIYLLVVKANKPWSVNVFFVLSLNPVIGLAYLSHRFVEKPIEGFLKSKLLKKKASTI